jgi:hypothetical protein
MVFGRHIVWLDGHRVIEGVTPKQLPAREPDETKAIAPFANDARCRRIQRWAGRPHDV